MLFQIELLLPLLLWGSTIPISSASDTTSLSDFPPKSDYRCGINEYMARTNCGRVCIFESDCNSGEYCWGTFPNTCYFNELSANTPTNGIETSTSDSAASTPTYSTPRTDFRCGSNEEDSRSNCGKVCIYNSDCESDEYCWSTFPNMCYMNDLSANSPTDSPVNSTPLTGSPIAPMADSPITPMTTRPVTSASVETVSPPPVNMVSPTAAPVDPTMAPISTTLTPVNNGSVALPTPALVLPTKAPVNPPLEPLSAASVIESPPKSDFRCGRDEEDSRTNCGKVCVYTTDCTVIGETCWGTFPNTCYTDELPVVEQTTNPVSSMPLTDSPTTAVPTTLSPITSAPVKTTFAPINTSTITISPVNSTPLTDSPVTTAPTTLRPITSLPVKITFAPVKITSAPVTTTSAPVTTTSAPVTLAPVTLAPIIIADPTSGPDTEPRLCPEVPPDGCSICGEGKCVGAPDNIFEFPGQPIISCGILESVGLGGSIPLAQCEGITSIEPLKACECRDSVAPIAPTSAPVDPTSAPVDSTSAPVDPTAAPVDPTSTPVDPTSAPVDPTSAPVDITSAPVDITPAPVDPTSAPVDPTQAPISTTPVTTNDSVPPPPVLESPPRSDFRCGINEEDSRVNCGRVCIFNSDCEGGEYCWSTFPNTCYANSLPPASIQDNLPLDSENLEAISDFRCGTSEAVARGNCKSTCITQATCNLGEYCWATLPNYCHANSEGRN